MRVAGFDGCKQGWVAVSLVDGRWEAASLHRGLDEALERFSDCSIIGIDMAIGLPDGEAFSRQADAEARALLGPRRSSVFVTPPVALLETKSHAEALALCRKNGWPGVSAQSYALHRKTLECNRLAHRDDRLHEVHPEVSFRAMAGTELEHSKHTWAGMTLRRSVLCDVGIAIPDEIGAAGAAGPSDVLDAAAAAWSAHRIAAGTALALPTSGSGRFGRIWY